MRGSLLLPFSYSHFLLTIERKAHGMQGVQIVS